MKEKKEKSKPKKLARKRSTRVERTQYRRGAFLHGWLKGGPKDKEAFLEVLKANSPRGRVAKWKPHSERLAVGLDDISEAESLITARGSVTDVDRFDLCMTRAQADIEAAQVEKSLVPLAVEGARTKEQRQRGGKESRTRKAPELRERNRELQTEIDRLCLKEGHSFKRACEIVARRVKDPDTEERRPLHPDHIRKRIAKNPLRKK